MLSAAPISPEERFFSNHEGMQEHAHLTRLARLGPIPLTLFAQRTGAAIADAGGIDHTETPAVFLTLLLGMKDMACRALKRSVGLARKV